MNNQIPMKRAKICLRTGEYVRCRRRSAQQEKKVACDEMHKPFVRGKRSVRQLPDTWDTQFIKIQRSWKWRCRKTRQWLSHKLTSYEIKYLKVGKWRNIVFKGHSIKVQEHEEWIFALDGAVFVAKEDPYYYEGGLYLSSWFIKYFCRQIRHIKVGNEFVCELCKLK
jgi:hypothetical protein